MIQRDKIQIGYVEKNSISHLSIPVSKPVEKLMNTCSCSEITIYQDKIEFKIKAPTFIPFQIKGDYKKILNPIIHYKDNSTEQLYIEMIIKS